MIAELSEPIVITCTSARVFIHNTVVAVMITDGAVAANPIVFAGTFASLCVQYTSVETGQVTDRTMRASPLSLTDTFTFACSTLIGTTVITQWWKMVAQTIVSLVVWSQIGVCTHVRTQTLL